MPSLPQCPTCRHEIAERQPDCEEDEIVEEESEVEITFVCEQEVNKFYIAENSVKDMVTDNTSLLIEGANDVEADRYWLEDQGIKSTGFSVRGKYQEVTVSILFDGDEL